LLDLLFSRLPPSPKCWTPRCGVKYQRWRAQYWRGKAKVATLVSVAVELDDKSLLHHLIAHGYKSASVYKESREEKTKCTPLQEAVKRGDVDMARLLIEGGEDVNEKPRVPGGRSALQHAVEQQNLEIIQLLFESGVDVNGKPARKNGATALQLAAIKGFLGIAKLLLDLEPPSDINAQRARVGGRTALEGAAEHGRIDMVKLLLIYGVETTGRGRRQYLRAIKFAEANGHSAVVRILKEHRTLTPLENIYLEHDEELMKDGVSDEELSEVQQSDDNSTLSGTDTDDSDTDDSDTDDSDTDDSDTDDSDTDDLDTDDAVTDDSVTSDLDADD